MRVQFTGGGWVGDREVKRGQELEVDDAVAAEVVKAGLGRIADEPVRRATASAPAEARKAVRIGNL